MNNLRQHRVFFGFKVLAPWPDSIPNGRLLSSEDRHMTVAFIGNTEIEKLLSVMNSFTPLSFRVGKVGFFDKDLFLPYRKPRVVAWHVQWFEDDIISSSQKDFSDWLRKKGYILDRRGFLPHVTIARPPFVISEWKKAFCRLPMMITGLHLYESVGNLVYESRWHYPLIKPFQEIEHTADLAFKINGENLKQIYLNAQVALSWEFLPFMDYIDKNKNIQSLDDIILSLNEIIAKIDEERGCPLKAVSFHGEIKKTPENTLTWEMIVDV